MSKSSKMNRKSYSLTMLFMWPALALSRAAGVSSSFIAPLSQIIAMVLLVYIIIWTIRRLKNTAKSAWWTLALIPPGTIFILAYCCFAHSSDDHQDKHLYMYGIRAQGFWRIAAIVLISMLLLYIIFMNITLIGIEA